MRVHTDRDTQDTQETGFIICSMLYTKAMGR